MNLDFLRQRVPQLNSDGDGRSAWRLITLVWQINLLPIFFVLLDRTRESFDVPVMLGWIGLAGFIAIFTATIMGICPHWVSSPATGSSLTQLSIVALSTIVAGFSLAFPDNSFELYLIYPGCSAGSTCGGGSPSGTSSPSPRSLLPS
jgi:predicted membrane channel-forming protein YqfA (hemolysin III family)